ncbi:hypothetical protein [Salinarimonas soli]|uniref:Uncharacterized protein n=1 Tax=Salinarimonas soli TaxID=1638099 RepID=A0A5B2VFF2_9HYPH|nr:hypothetical protein [Salinarimonas soli]KAA2237694.1 hypothetical protein F0L46_08420 [Salinarimonas soli]
MNATSSSRPKVAARAAPGPGATTRDKRRRARQQHAKTARDTEIEVVEHRVEDPWPDPARDPLLAPQRVPVAFNRRVDLLEVERAHKRITEAEYCTGRLVQAVFERAMGQVGGGGWNAGDKVDAALKHELTVIYALDTAEKVQGLVQRIERAVGTVGTRFLRQVLVGRVSFAQYAAQRGKGGDRGTSQVAGHFRFLLEDLSEAWAARGVAAGEGALTEDGRGTDRRRETAIRGHQELAGEGEEFDAAGTQVPVGKGFRLANDAGAVDRWRPAAKRKQLEREAVDKPALGSR